MVNYKKNICLLTAFLMMLSITACTPEESKELDKATPVTEQNIADNGSIGALLEETPSHMSQVFSENFSVEADIHIPNVQKADVLFAKYMKFDEQTLLSVFYDGKTPSKKTNPVDNAITYQDNSSNMVVSNNYFLYRSKDFEYLKFPTDNFISTSDISSANRRFNEVYKHENLNFMTKAEAFDTVRNVLKRLSIDTMDNAEIYAIDFQTMQKQQEERIQRDYEIQKKMGVSPLKDPTYGYQIKDKFTQDDDFYILYFTVKQDKIPVTQKSYNIMNGERNLMGSTVRVSLSKKGVSEFICYGIYEPLGIAESPSTLISVEKALQKAYEIHNAIITTDKVTVKAIDFEYVPVAYNKNYGEVKLTPAWSLALTYEHDKPSKDGKKALKSTKSTRMVFINAVTGEEIK